MKWSSTSVAVTAIAVAALVLCSFQTWFRFSYLTSIGSGGPSPIITLTPGRWGIAVASAAALNLFSVLGFLRGPFRLVAPKLLLGAAPFALTMACAIKLGLRASFGSAGFPIVPGSMQPGYYSMTWAVYVAGSAAIVLLAVAIREFRAQMKNRADARFREPVAGGQHLESPGQSLPT